MSVRSDNNVGIIRENVTALRIAIENISELDHLIE